MSTFFCNAFSGAMGHNSNTIKDFYILMKWRILVVVYLYKNTINKSCTINLFLDFKVIV